MSGKVVSIGGKSYTFDLNVAAHRRVKAAADISLPDCVADVSGSRSPEEREKALSGFESLMKDFDRLPLVVRAMLRPQLDANGVTDEQFDNLFDGPTAVACANALTQALIDFFHGGPRGKLLAAAVEMAKQTAVAEEKWLQRGVEATTKRMEMISKTLDSQKGADAADAMVQQMLTNSSTTLPESLASILTPSP